MIPADVKTRPWQFRISDLLIVTTLVAFIVGLASGGIGMAFRLVAAAAVFAALYVTLHRCAVWDG